MFLITTLCFYQLSFDVFTQTKTNFHSTTNSYFNLRHLFTCKLIFVQSASLPLFLYNAHQFLLTGTVWQT